MSKERELLKQAEELIHTISVMAGIDGVRIPTNIGVELRLEIQGLLALTDELLAQPEQEPEAWMLIDKETGARIPRADKPKHERNKDRWEQYPLYTSPPKREPLSDEYIDLYCKNKNIKALERLRFYHGVNFAEKAHGIGE